MCRLLCKKWEIILSFLILRVREALVGTFHAFVISSRWVRIPYPALYKNPPQLDNYPPIGLSALHKSKKIPYFRSDLVLYFLPFFNLLNHLFYWTVLLNIKVVFILSILVYWTTTEPIVPSRSRERFYYIRTLRKHCSIPWATLANLKI